MGANVIPIFELTYSTLHHPPLTNYLNCQQKK